MLAFMRLGKRINNKAEEENLIKLINKMNLILVVGDVWRRKSAMFF